MNSFIFGDLPAAGAPSVGEAKLADAVTEKARAAIGIWREVTGRNRMAVERIMMDEQGGAM